MAFFSLKEIIDIFFNVGDYTKFHFVINEFKLYVPIDLAYIVLYKKIYIINIDEMLPETCDGIH